MHKKFFLMQRLHIYFLFSITSSKVYIKSLVTNKKIYLKKISINEYNDSNKL
jgi:hypothetical protein